MRPLFRIHEWLADRIDWVQYPKLRVSSLNGHPHGWRARWQARPPMNRAMALCLPTAMLFVPYIGVYLAILSVVFLFAYFRRK
jgi:hypothetical protein